MYKSRKYNILDSNLDSRVDSSLNSSIYPNNNNTNYTFALKHNLGSLKYTDGEFLKFHQFIVDKYVSQNPDIRGLLLYFNVGFGKTIMAISLALFYKKLDPERKIVVILSKGLIDNFKTNIVKFVKANPEFEEIIDITKINDVFKFISFRSSFMYREITNIRKSEDMQDFENQIKLFQDSFETPAYLENTVLIVDEAHNFFNAITNGSKNSIKLYDTVMKTRNIKLFFMTGTPIVNDPFELVPCFNMLRGYITEAHSKHNTLFPEMRKNFYNYFVNKKEDLPEIKNKDKFQNRILGLSSYYGDLYFETRDENYPETLPIIVEKVPMSGEQYSAYSTAYDFEKGESLYHKADNSERFSTKNDSISTYKIKTRQLSNFLIPEYALGPVQGKKMRIKFVDKITPEDWKNRIEVMSPKIVKLFENIQTHENQLGLIYSEFVNGEGLEVIAKYLETMNYTRVYANSDFSHKKIGREKLTEKKEKGEKSQDQSQEKSQEKKGGTHPKTFTILTGKLTLNERDTIVNVFNDTDNIKGDKISLILVNKIAAEGLDLKCIRHIHIFEPFWNYSRIEQVMGRGIRYQSHTELPKSEQNVQTYIYLSDYPKGIPDQADPTTDISMFKRALETKELNKQFLKSIIESSMDCLVHEKSFTDGIKKNIKCKLCTPTNKPLYHNILHKDISLPDPCIPPEDTKINAKEILYEGHKYAYTKSNDASPLIKIFKHNDKIDRYVELGSHNKEYSELAKKILFEEV